LVSTRHEGDERKRKKKKTTKKEDEKERERSGGDKGGKKRKYNSVSLLPHPSRELKKPKHRWDHCKKKKGGKEITVSSGVLI